MRASSQAWLNSRVDVIRVCLYYCSALYLVGWWFLQIMKYKLKETVYSGPSDIHGTGLFARKNIEQGTYIGTYRGPETRTDGTYVLWVYEDDAKPTGRVGSAVSCQVVHVPPAISSVIRRAVVIKGDLFVYLNVSQRIEIKSVELRIPFIGMIEVAQQIPAVATRGLRTVLINP